VEHFETVRVAKDGRAVDVSLSVSPLRDVSGKVVEAIFAAAGEWRNRKRAIVTHID